MRPQRVSVAFNGTASAAVPMDYNREAGWQATVRVTTTLTTAVKVQFTLNNILNGETAVWADAPASTGLEAVAGATTETAEWPFPVTALRLAVTGGAGGVGTMEVLQQG